MNIQLFWVPAYVNEEVNEIADSMAKHIIKWKYRTLSKSEIKPFMNKFTQTTWQDLCYLQETGRHLYRIQKHGGERKTME